MIGLGLLGAAGVVAWFIFERSITYELSGDSVAGTVSWRTEDRALAFRQGTLSWRGGVAVVRARGSLFELGAAHGRLLAPSVLELGATAAPSLAALVRPQTAWTRLTAEMRVGWRLRFLDEGLADSDRAWLAGVARGAGATDEQLQALVRAQAVWDVGVPAPGADGSGLTRSLAVLALPESATGGRAWLGHAWSAPGLVDGGDSLAPVVTLARPSAGHAWAGVGWAGLAGVTSGVNARGVAVAVAPARTRDVRPTRVARPVLLLARAVLEQAGSLDEAVRLLEGATTLGAASFLVVDGAAGRWAVVERSPVRAVVTKAAGPVVLGDALVAPAFAADPQNDRTRRLAPSAPRVARALALVRAPLPSAAELAAALRDRRDATGTVRPLGHRGVLFDPSAHVAIIDPGLRVLWVADPSAQGRMRAFDLRYELEGQGERAAPPPDLLADPSVEPEAVAALARARRELRACRVADAAGELLRAKEHADRALAFSPELPEALAAAADLAARAGDLTAARAAWQRWLDGGADEPDRAQQVQAQLSGAR